MKRFLSLFLAFILLASLSGCGGKADQDFTAVLPGDVTSLDPQTASGQAASLVIGSLYEGLCRVSEDSRPLPGVAERWSHNRDYTQFTFHLRKAKWSDGSPVTAEDFVFGVVRALTPETGAAALEDLFLLKNAKAFYAGEAAEDQLGIRAENERTLVVELENSYPDFPMLTAGNHYMPCNRAYFEESAGHYGLSAEYTLTNGPFTFPHMYAWDTDYNERSLTLARSDTYRGEHKTSAASLTYLIDYNEIVDSDPAAALLQGTADLLEVSESTARSAEEKGCGLLAVNDGVTGLLFNPHADFLDYVGSRELLIKTLDRQDLAARGKTDQNNVAAGVMPDCVLWDGESYYGQDETCFFPQDDEITQTIPSLLELMELDQIPGITVLCPDDKRSIDLANGLLISWNNKLGAALNILPLPENELKSRVSQGDFEAALYTLRAGGATPFHVLEAFSSAASPLLLDSETFDEALQGLSFSRDSFRAAEEALRDQCVFYPLFTAKTYYALAPGVSGIAISPDQRIDFSQGRKK